MTLPQALFRGSASTIIRGISGSIGGMIYSLARRISRACRYTPVWVRYARSMDLVYLGHSSFRLHASGMVVVTDPFPSSLGLRMDPRPAAVVTISNSQPNHSAAGTVSGSPKVFRAPGEYEYSGIVVRGVMTPLPPSVPHERRNVAYTIEMEGINVCHLGGLALPLTTRQIDELKPVEVLLAPAGGQSALSPDQALQTIQDLDPRIVVPMHYAHGETSAALGGPEAFLRRLGQDEIQPQPRLVVTLSNLPADLRVNLLSPPRS